MNVLYYFVRPPFGNGSRLSHILWWAWLILWGVIGWWLEPRIFP